MTEETTIQALLDQESDKLVESYRKTEDYHLVGIICDMFQTALLPHLTSLLTSKDKEIERLQGQVDKLLNELEDWNDFNNPLDHDIKL